MRTRTSVVCRSGPASRQRIANVTCLHHRLLDRTGLDGRTVAGRDRAIRSSCTGATRRAPMSALAVGSWSAEAAVVGDLSSIRGNAQRRRAGQPPGRLDAIIHNAGISHRESQRIKTEERLPQPFATNTPAPYVLPSSHKPKRLVYPSSGMHWRREFRVRQPISQSGDGARAHSQRRGPNTVPCVDNRVREAGAATVCGH